MSANEIRQYLANYLAGNVSIADFEDWIAQSTWNIHQSGDEEAQEIGYLIEAKLAEYSGHAITEDGLRKELLPMVTFYTARLPFAPARLPQLQSETKWYSGVLRIGASVDRSPAVVFG